MTCVATIRPFPPGPGWVPLILAASLLAGGCNSKPDRGAAADIQSARAPASSEPQGTAQDPPALVFIEFVATPHDVVDRMLKTAKVTKHDVVCDLGCGAGRILIAAAKRYGCRAIGYDLDPIRVEEARENAKREGVSHLVTVEQKNVLSVDLEGVSVVTLYMGTEINARLIPQLSRLGPGARIVSHDFGIGNLPPDRTVTMTSREDRRPHRVYLWRCPISGKSE